MSTRTETHYTAADAIQERNDRREIDRLQELLDRECESPSRGDSEQIKLRLQEKIDSLTERLSTYQSNDRVADWLASTESAQPADDEAAAHEAASLTLDDMLERYQEHMAMAEAIQNRIESMRLRLTAAQSKAEEAKAAMLETMRADCTVRAVLPLGTLDYQQGRERVVVDHPDKLPTYLLRTKTITAPDKGAIAEALREGSRLEHELIEAAGARIERGPDFLRISMTEVE